jgi:hypothetical protein
MDGIRPQRRDASRARKAFDDIRASLRENLYQA